MSKKEEIKQDNVLEDSIASLEKQFGKGIITTLNDNLISDVKKFSTGYFGLDIILGGGLAEGRIVEMIGENGSGKTTITLGIIAEVQRSGNKCVFIDSEHAFDKTWAEKNGVIIDELLFAQPDTAEDALTIVETIAHTRKVRLIIVDSVAALVSKAELEGDIGQSHMGLTARIIGQALRKIVGICAKTGTTVIFLNQYRASLAMFGPSKVTTGGNSLPYFSSIRMELKRKEIVKKGDESLATIIQVKTLKNKTFIPYKTTNIEIRFDEGVSKVSDILLLAIDNKIISKNASWYVYNDKKWQGDESIKSELKENKELFDEIKNKLLEIIKNNK